MLVIGAGHMPAAAGAEALGVLAVPLLWMAGVLLVIAYKLRSR